MVKDPSELVFLLLLVTTLGQAGLSKILGASVPSWFVEQFQNTFLNAFPHALALSFFGIAIFELTSASLIVVSLVARVVSDRHTTLQTNLLRTGIVISQLTFLMLALGQRITLKFDSAAMLFFYSAFTFIGGQLILKQKRL